MVQQVRLFIDLLFLLFGAYLGIHFVRSWKTLGERAAKSESSLGKLFGIKSSSSKEYEWFAGRFIFFTGIAFIILFGIAFFLRIFNRLE